MLEWIDESTHRDLYDPAFGLGAFYPPLNSCLPEFDYFSASEIDSTILSHWSSYCTQKNLDIECEDYLLSWGKKHGNIVCNPPYMRFQKFTNRTEVFTAFLQHLHIKLSGYTNTASAFLIKSISELKSGGRLAYIMPSEFLNTGYGEIPKSILLQNKHLSAIIKLHCEREAFPDANTSLCIILYDSSNINETVKFYSISALSQLDSIFLNPPLNEICVKDLVPKQKWGVHFLPKDNNINESLLTPLALYGRFSRGIATGANDFFVLRPSQISELNITRKEIIPCITKSAQIKKMITTDDDYNALFVANEPVLLFSPSPSQVSAESQTYLHHGESLGYHERFLTKSRTPWFKTESRPHSSPILLNVFSRNGYKVIRNHANMQHLTCFHGFNPNLIGRAYIDHLFLYLLSDVGHTILSRSKRTYGDQLDKFEPNDLNTAAVPSMQFFDTIPTKTVQEILHQVSHKNSIPPILNQIFQPLIT